MTFDPETVYNELHPYFQKRVQRHEPLARHAAFGVGGPADVWISLEAKPQLHCQCGRGECCRCRGIDHGSTSGRPPTMWRGPGVGCGATRRMEDMIWQV